MIGRRTIFSLGVVAAMMLPTAGIRAQNPTETMSPAPLVPHRSFQIPTFPADPNRAKDFTLPDGAVIPLPQNPGRYFRFAPRYGRLNNQSGEKLPDGTQRIVYTGGVIVYVSPGPADPEIEFATDDAVVWIRGGQKVDNPAGGFEATSESKREVEVYLSGNVVIRTVSPGANGNSFMQTLRAEQVYYDVARSRAIALAADLELSSPRIPDGIHLTGREIRRLDHDNWEVLTGSAFSTKLPADPGLRFDSPRVTLRERTAALTNVFGIPYKTFAGEEVLGTERILTARNSVGRLNGVPFFYWPYLRTELNEPLGPLLGLGGGQDRIFGTQVYSTWDMYKILALRPPDGHKWTLNLDFLSDRGPAAGTDYYYSVPVREGGFTPGEGLVRLYGMSDGGVDVLGDFRGPVANHPSVRGRALWRHQQEILEGLYFQGQVSYLSDQNFHEQYYKQEFDFAPSQESFGYLTWQRDNLWASGLVLPRVGQNWMTRTEWLPKFDGALIGQSFWDLFVYNTRASAGYAQLSTSNVIPYPVLPTDQNTNTARLNWNQELSVPFDLGPVKLAPYGVLDLSYYSKDLTGDDAGRVYGAGGVRANLPLSRLYDSVSSDLFNIHGLYHKLTLSANYFYGQSNIPSSQLPLLDRLDDDNTDYSYRYIRPAQTTLVPGAAGFALATSPLFNQQQYAIRRLVDNRVDSLDDMQVLQGGVRQRFQTKRGYPGLEHTVDVLTLDVTASYFPDANRDNYGKPFAFMEYTGLWNIGDRTSVLSSGWVDPFDFGAKYWTLGLSLDRPDRTNVYIGYRQTDPINSKAVTASLGYQLSRRYYGSAGVSYDFGIQQALTNTFAITRTGSDMSIMVGVTYNALVNNFGLNFMIVPNIVSAFLPGFGSPGYGGGNRR